MWIMFHGLSKLVSHPPPRGRATQILAYLIIDKGPPNYMGSCVKWPKLVLRGLWQGLYLRNGNQKTCFMMRLDYVCVKVYKVDGA